MAEGIVKWFDSKKGYGSIESENDKDLSVHKSSIDKPGLRTLTEADKVSFEIEETDRGPQANNVRKI